jgi:hypothetical protein
MLVSCSELLLPVSAQGAEGELLARLALHLRQQVGVADGAMRAVGGESRRTDVTTDLCAAQHAWSAAACLLLQRGRRPIPALMPSADGSLSSLHTMATGECSEAVSAAAWSVLEEDGVLGVGAEVRRHGAVRERGDGVTWIQSSSLSARESWA